MLSTIIGLGSNLSSIKIKIIAAVVLAAIIISGYFFIQSLRSQLETAALRAHQMEETIRMQQVAMDTLRNDIARINQIQTNLFDQLNNAQSTTRDLERRFSQDAAGRARNFATTANRNPARAEERVNLGTRDALRCNEIATGAPLTEEERNGTRTNSICPELIRSRTRR